MNRPKQQPAEGPSDDMQFAAFLGFLFLMVAVLGACGALHA